jgi:hypothetical protein
MSNTAAGTHSGPAGRIARILVVAAAGVAQLVVLVPFTVASGLLAPLWAIVLFYVLWLVAAFVLVRLARRRPFVTPLVPVANAALLWLAISAGEAWLGWTA